MGNGLESIVTGRRAHGRLPALSLWLACAAATTAVLGVAGPALTASPPSVYLVAKYPVQAQASDAVTAKAQALADAQQGAFRALMKRLVPVTSYKRLPKVPLARIQDMVAGFSVRSERNSSTEYLASYDFEFQARAVRELLRSNGLVAIEDVAQPTTVVAAYGVPGSAARIDGKAAAGKMPAQATSLPTQFQPARAAPTWLKAWTDLDTEHTLTPVRLAKSNEPLPEDAVRNVLSGDGSALSRLAGAEAGERTVLAYAEPSVDGRKLRVTLAGRDAVGWLSVTRTYPLTDGDVGYATELAAVVGLGILEGRWKALKTSRGPNTGTVSADGVEGWSTTTDKATGDQIVTAARPASGGLSDDIELMVEFRGLGQWQQLRQRLTQTPGVEDLEVGQMSARSASVKLRYPGGPERLAVELGSQGLQLTSQDGQWVLQQVR